MSYELSGNLDTIYVPYDKSSSGMIIATICCAALFLVIWNIIPFIHRFLAARQQFPGMPLDAKTRRKGVTTLVCSLVCVLSLAAYALNPNYQAEQEQAAQIAIQDIQDRFHLQARWKYAPYNPFDDDSDRVGKLYIEVNGRSYPTRISPTEYDNPTHYGPSKKKDFVMLVVEVLTNDGYVPISTFSRQVTGQDPAY